MIAAGLLLAVTANAAQLVSTPRAMLVPASETNRPFLSAASALAPVDLAAQGYAEDELLVSGQASVYEWSPAGAREAVTARAPRVPYVTRLLVRRPVDTRRFSGRVIVELLDAPENYDTAPLWGLSSEQFLRSGDVWVGITVSPRAVATLEKFDPIRYESLNLVNPQSADCKAASAAAVAAANASDTGLAWDLIAQSGALLRSTSHENPLRNYSPRRVILAGYGQGAVTSPPSSMRCTPACDWATAHPSSTAISAQLQRQRRPSIPVQQRRTRARHVQRRVRRWWKY